MVQTGNVAIDEYYMYKYSQNVNVADFISNAQNTQNKVPANISDMMICSSYCYMYIAETLSTN